MTLGHLKTSRGFTLIELLVVIAIIGILSSVVLASLNTARNRGADAAAKSNLANARAEAELFYDGNPTGYTGVCATTGTNVIGDSVQAALTALGSAAVVGTHCNASATAYAASTPDLKETGNQYFCVDSTGFASTTATAPTLTDQDCD
ncbi:MAG: type II secretion system protein [Patescibacteria group bacterium]